MCWEMQITTLGIHDAQYSALAALTRLVPSFCELLPPRAGQPNLSSYLPLQICGSITNEAQSVQDLYKLNAEILFKTCGLVKLTPHQRKFGSHVHGVHSQIVLCSELL